MWLCPRKYAAKFLEYLSYNTTMDFEIIITII